MTDHDVEIPAAPPMPEQSLVGAWAAGRGSPTGADRQPRRATAPMSDRGPWVWVAVIAGGILVAAAIIAIAVTIGGPARTASRQHARVTAEERLAQSDLRNAIAEAKTYFTDGDTYAGFDPSTAGAIEPALSWVGDTPALPGIVNINLVSDTQVVMSTVSLSGQTYCIGDTSVSGTTFGRVDGHGAITAADCSGGW